MGSVQEIRRSLLFLTGYIGAHPYSTQLWRAYTYLGQAKAREAFEKAMAAAHDVSERTEVQDTLNELGSEGK